jgi:hypothetical protein
METRSLGAQGARDAERGPPPTFLGVLTAPNGEDVRRYYEERAARRQRCLVMRRVIVLAARRVVREIRA